jgi:hypothetical protein
VARRDVAVVYLTRLASRPSRHAYARGPTIGGFRGQVSTEELVRKAPASTPKAPRSFTRDETLVRPAAFVRHRPHHPMPVLAAQRSAASEARCQPRSLSARLQRRLPRLPGASRATKRSSVLRRLSVTGLTAFSLASLANVRHLPALVRPAAFVRHRPHHHRPHHRPHRFLACLPRQRPSPACPVFSIPGAAANLVDPHQVPA